MKRLLWIGDAAVSTGFARCTHAILEVLRRTWDVSVLGLNYLGDPHPYPYPIYPCWSGGDAFGVNRFAELLRKLRPDVVVIQNDPWNMAAYLQQLESFEKAGGKRPPLVAVIALDGKNCKDAPVLGQFAGVVCWTDFALNEIRLGGYAGPAVTIPLGVDLERYTPGDRAAAREHFGLPPHVRDGWIVGNVNRNQPRKRLDLTVKFFAEWVRQYAVDDAFLSLHVAPTGEQSWDVAQLARYFGLRGRLLLTIPEIGHGLPESELVEVYRTFDVQVNTGQGEGWGLTTMEGMACGVPQIVPRWSALAEWAAPAAVEIPCSTISVTPNSINVVGGIPDEEPFVAALQRWYTDRGAWTRARDAGLALVRDPRFSWTQIGERYAAALQSFLPEGVC